MIEETRLRHRGKRECPQNALYAHRQREHALHTCLAFFPTKACGFLESSMTSRRPFTASCYILNLLRVSCPRSPALLCLRVREERNNAKSDRRHDGMCNDRKLILITDINKTSMHVYQATNRATSGRKTLNSFITMHTSAFPSISHHVIIHSSRFPCHPLR